MPRKVFVAGEILTAADVNTNLMDQAVMVFDDSAARGSAIPTPSEGMVTYLKDTNQVQAYDGSAFAPLGTILQVVRATDSTDRTTSSGTFTDASISATITPLSASSDLLVYWFFGFSNPAGGNVRGRAETQITDSSNTALSGAQSVLSDFQMIGGGRAHSHSLLGVVAAGSTAAQTFKGRFRLLDGNAKTILNATQTGQIVIMEVAG
jgi:hypothetical protein